MYMANGPCKTQATSGGTDCAKQKKKKKDGTWKIQHRFVDAFRSLNYEVTRLALSRSARRFLMEKTPASSWVASVSGHDKPLRKRVNMRGKGRAGMLGVLA